MSDSRATTLVCPGPDGWIGWQQSADGEWKSSGHTESTGKPWELVAARAPWILCLPARALQTIAIRLPLAEGSRLEDVVPLRVEAAGLATGEDGLVLADWRVAERQGERHTVTAWSVDPAVLEGCPPNRTPDAITPAVARWIWQPQDLVLWCEHGRWIAAFTADSFPVHIQPCSAVENTEALAADLRGQAMALVLRGLAAAPRRLVTRGDASHFAPALAQALELPLVELPDHPGCLPPDSRLLCKEMLAARQARVEAGKWRRRTAAAAALWLGLAGYGAWLYIQAKNDLDATRAAYEAVIPKAEALRAVQESWDLILSANSVEAFPLETLARLTVTMPPADFRLTQFTVEGDRDVFLKGSAKRPDLALKFAQDLRRDKNLAAYAWETPYPVNEKDGTATFSYQGKFRQNTP